MLDKSIYLDEDVIKFTGIKEEEYFDLHNKIYDRDYYIAIGLALNLTVKKLNGLLERRTYRLTETLEKDIGIVKLIIGNKEYKNLEDFNDDLFEYYLDQEEPFKNGSQFDLIFSTIRSTAPISIVDLVNRSKEIEDLENLRDILNIKEATINKRYLIFEEEDDIILIEPCVFNKKEIYKYSLVNFKYINFSKEDLNILSNNGYHLGFVDEEVYPHDISYWMYVEDEEYYS